MDLWLFAEIKILALREVYAHSSGHWNETVRVETSSVCNMEDIKEGNSTKNVISQL